MSPSLFLTKASASGPLVGGTGATDSFAAAPRIVVPSGGITFDQSGFTDEANEPNITSSAPTVSQSTKNGWLKFTPNSDCTVIIDNFGSSLTDTNGGSSDLALHVYKKFDEALPDTLTNLVLVAYNDDIGGTIYPANGAFSQVTFAAKAHITYWIQAGIHGEVPNHYPVLDYHINWSGIDFTPSGQHQNNDLLANAIVISGSSQDYPWNNLSYDDDFAYFTNSGGSGWYKFTPTTNCAIVLDTMLSSAPLGSAANYGSLANSTDTYLRLLTGPTGATSASQLTSVAVDDDSGGGAGGSGGSSRLAWTCTAGVTYYVLVSSYGNPRSRYCESMVFRWAGIV